MPKTAKQLAAEARALVEQVKSLNADTKSAGQSGIDDGQKAEQARKMLADATRIAGEAKAARESEEAAKSAALLEAFDKKTAHVDQDSALNRKGESDFEAPDVSESLVISKSVAQQVYGKNAAKLAQADMKVLSEDYASQGGYLVVPEYHQEMFAEVRTTGNALRSLGWVNVHPTRSNKILIPLGAGASTMGWTAENDPSPSQDQSFGQLEVSVFEATGISKVSLSLFEDGDPAALDLAINELARRAAILEEQAWISGNGSGKPLGILNTPGVQTETIGASLDTQQEQIDAVLNMCSKVITNYFAPVTGILVAPRRYAFWRKAKDSSNNYLFNLPNTFRAPGEFSKSQYDGGDILGVPLGQSANIPTNLGSGTNEDRIIAGDWSEAHAFIRRDLTIDTNTQSDSAFANRQVHVRLTFRQGFTGGRQPKAFCVGGGDGLVP